MFIDFCIFCLSAASKTVLNSMLKEPSLIPDLILAQNIQQVSVLKIIFLRIKIKFSCKFDTVQYLLDDISCLSDEVVLAAVVMPASPPVFLLCGLPFSHLPSSLPPFIYHIIFFPAVFQCTINDCCYGPLVDCIKQYPIP